MKLLVLILIVFVSGCGAGESDCVPEGELIPVIQNPPECCEGLSLIPPQDSGIVGSAGYCTSGCGDALCDDERESQYNCPLDCFGEEPLDMCDVGVETVLAFELPFYDCDVLPGCEWRTLGGEVESYYACCPKDLDLNDETSAIYDRCFYVD